MKKFMTLLCFIFSFQLYAQDNNEYIMYQTIQLKAKAGHVDDLRDGLKAHNDKFHTGGSDAVSVWAIRSGPDAAGGFSWVKGPMTWTSMDKPLTGGHMDDWQKNVAAHADVGEFGFWRLVDDMSYTPENFQVSVMRIRWFNIRPGKADNAREDISKLLEVYRQNNLDIGVYVFANQTAGEDGPDWGILWQHENWASMDQNNDFVAKFEALHGTGSWSEWFRDWTEETVEFKGTQLNALIPELSTPTE